MFNWVNNANEENNEVSFNSNGNSGKSAPPVQAHAISEGSNHNKTIQNNTINKASFKGILEDDDPDVFLKPKNSKKKKYLYYVIHMTVVNNQLTKYCITSYDEKGEAWFLLESTLAFKDDVTQFKLKKHSGETGKRSPIFGKIIESDGKLKQFINGTTYHFAYITRGMLGECITPLNVDQLKIIFEAEKTQEYM